MRAPKFRIQDGKKIRLARIREWEETTLMHRLSEALLLLHIHGGITGAELDKARDRIQSIADRGGYDERKPHGN